MSLEEIFLSYGTDPQVAHDAVVALAENKSLRGIVVSGKIAAGKDTLAPLILRRLDPKNEQVQIQFAFALKNEVSQVIQLIRDDMHADAAVLAERAAAQQDVPVEQALTIVNFILDEIRTGVGPKDGWDKTPGNRLALQFWGTEIRRNQNDNYFVSKAVQSAAAAFSEHKSVFVTDARFPNELIGMAELGFASFRIDVSPEEQQRRFFKREGTPLRHEATLHPSETALDDYEGFNSRVLTDGLDPILAVDALVEPFIPVY